MGRIKRKDSAQRGRPAVPDHWTGRPGGSGAQPPLHLIYMVKVGRHVLVVLLVRRSFVVAPRDCFLGCSQAPHKVHQQGLEIDARGRYSSTFRV